MKKRKRLKEYFAKEGGWNKKDVKEWIQSHCGTIHTFQGKEVEEVILLFGCTKVMGQLNGPVVNQIF